MLRRIYIPAGLIILGPTPPTLFQTATCFYISAHGIITASSIDGMPVSYGHDSPGSKASLILITFQLITIIRRMAPLSAMDVSESQNTVVGRPLTVTSTMISKRSHLVTILKLFVDRYLVSCQRCCCCL